MDNAKNEFRLNFLDRAIMAIAPERGLARARAKEKIHLFGYDAANPGRRRGRSGGGSANGNPESPRQQMEVVDIMWEARAMEKKSCLLVGTLDKITKYVCGGDMRYESQTGDSALDKEYEDYFHDWCGRADLHGRFRLKYLVQQAFRSFMRDGDSGVVLERRGRDWKVNVIEGDRIGDPNATYKSTETEFRGVVLDEDGAPTMFKVFKRTLHNQYKHEADVPAARFCHLLDPMRLRPGQYRPASMLAQALPKIRDIYEIMAHEMLHQKHAASYTAFRRGGSSGDWDNPAGVSPGSNTGPDGKPRPSMDAVSGKILNLEPGEDLVFAPATNRPSGAFMALLQSEIRELALSLDLTYGFLYDLTMLGGVTARLDVRSNERTLNRWKQLIEDLVLFPIRDAVILQGIAQGKIRGSKFFKQGRFLFGPFITADVGHEAQADASMLSIGATTRTAIAERNGNQSVGDIAATLAKEIKAFQKAAGDEGVPIELMVGSMPNATQLLAAMNTPVEDMPSDEEEDLPGMLGTYGDKGVQPMLDVLEKTSQGVMTPEAAVMALQVLYGWDAAMAGRIVSGVGAQIAPMTLPEG